MKKDSDPNFQTKAERRESKKRPRMKVHGSALRRPSKHAGMKLAKKRK